ncbi:MAG: hypothetical protein K6A43_07725 [Treponema sp.]|nr:hypothetical protein [Treponema sp.]
MLSLSSLAAENIPRFGSSGKLEGNIAVVTMFLDDTRTSWNFKKKQDLEMYDYAYYDVQVACDWITKSCKEYGRKVNFIWDWDKYNELYFSGAKIRIDATNESEDIYSEVQPIIKKYIDSEKIKKSLGANGIIYLACFNTHYSNTVTSMTDPWSRDYPINEEICYMFMRCDNDVEVPAMFAHEMLHTFGAPDLYTPGMYDITQKFIDYLESSKNNDIMGYRAGLLPNTDSYDYDNVPNALTEITAYYIGLTNSSKTVQQWGFKPSDYVSK